MAIQKRNMAKAVVDVHTPGATWNTWTTDNAVNQGYKVSGWVYKAVSMISKNISQVPWQVEDKDGKPVDGHPLTLLMENPNPEFSSQDVMELISAWQQLSGEAYLKIVYVNGQPAELWPISPDRISPIPSKDQMQLVEGYEVYDAKGVKVVSREFTPENVIAFKFLNPADPLRGIGPLQVAAKAVDVDQEQLNWNKAAMQNRGILDGIFMFKEHLDENKYNAVKRRIKELFQGKRDIGVIGSNATYQRLAQTVAEMDFLNSRKFNREEILIIFGIPPQLAGAQETSTYNNFSTARIVFWETTLIPILDDIKNTLNRVFKEQLGDLVLNYDLSGITALQKDRKEQAETAKLFASMGIPVSVLNEMLTLGIPEYDGWDESVTVKNSPMSEDEGRAGTGLMLKKLEQRSLQDELDSREKIAKNAVTSIVVGFKEQQDLVFDAMDNHRDVQGELLNMEDSLLEKAISDLYVLGAETSADNLQLRSMAELETRALRAGLADAIADVLAQEAVILKELSLINSTTVTKILDQIVAGEDENKTISQIQQGIVDSGTFDSVRALRIARTVSGTAQSIGQLSAGIDAGATQKTWLDSNFEVRPEHQNRDGETVGINERFSIQFPNGTAPRYPLDQNMIAADRINCSCSLIFS